jgi:hypothetical protein
MLVSDGRFGAVLVTSTGKQLTFDSVECALEYLNEPGVTGGRLWVADASAPRRLVPAEDAAFVIDGALRPPMGSVTSYASVDAAVRIEGASVATMNWTALQARQPAVSDAR